MARPNTNGNGQIQPRQEQRRGDLAGVLKGMEGEIRRALPKHISADRMARVALTALRTTPHLAECTPMSFMGSLMAAAQLGLEVNTPLGLAYLIPRWSKNVRGYECTLLLGYQGMLDLARRSGMVSDIYAHVVRDGDAFDYELGLDKKLRHVPGEREDGEITHVYAVARLKDGAPIFVVLTRRQVDGRRDRGGYKEESAFSPWKTDYEAMALKSAVRALWRWLPKSSEMAQAQMLDDAASEGRAPIFDASVGEVIVETPKLEPMTAQDEVPRDEWLKSEPTTEGGCAADESGGEAA